MNMWPMFWTNESSLITGGCKVPVELDRLRLENQRVVDTLNKKDGRRVRDNEMRGTGESQVPVIIQAEDLLNVRGREPRCSLSEVRWAEYVRYGKQVARFRRIRSDIECRMRTGEGSEGNQLSSNTGTEREYLASIQAVPGCLRPQIPDRALDVLDLSGKLELRSKPVVHAGDRITI